MSSYITLLDTFFNHPPMGIFLKYQKRQKKIGSFLKKPFYCTTNRPIPSLFLKKQDIRLKFNIEIEVQILKMSFPSTISLNKLAKSLFLLIL